MDSHVPIQQNEGVENNQNDTPSHIKRGKFGRMKAAWRNPTTLVFVLFFAAIGSILLFKSFAATTSLTKTWDTNTDWATGSVNKTKVVAGSGNGSVVLASAPSPTTNLSLNKTATASSSLSNCTLPANAFDFNSATSWTSQASDAQWVKVDLGKSYPISQVNLNWGANYAKAYQIQISNDNLNWQDIYTTTTGTTGANNISSFLISNPTGQYVRMNATARGTTGGYSLIGMNILSAQPLPATIPSSNLSLNKAAVASSQTSSCTAPNYAFDANGSTSWTSQANDSEWVRVDLGFVYNINDIKLNWGTAYASAYKLQVSNDATNWTDIYSTTTGAAGSIDITNFSLPTVTGRYVRMLGVTRGTTGGYSLIGMNVYGKYTGSITLPFDASQTVNWTNLAGVSTPPADAGITYQARTSNDNTNWSTWNKDITQVADSRYIQIQAILTTNNTGSPQLDSLTLGYDTIDNTPSVTLTAQPTSVNSGQSSTLTWSSTNTTSCTASGAWSGTQPTSGTASTGALNSDSTFNLACTGAGGTANKSVTVTVIAPPPSTYRDTIMADSPIAYWRFANTNSETGNYNGTLRGSPPPLLGQTGPFTGSLSARFDGVLRDNATTGGFLANSLARLSSSTWTNGFTLEAWAKTTTTGPEQHVMTFSLADGTARPGILFDDPSDVWKFRDGTVSLSMNGTTTINAWHYLVASVDGSGNGILYVDGVNVKTWNSTVKPTATTDGLFTVGADYDAHNCPCPHVDTPFNGWIAEAAVYNHPLSAARVQAHFVAR